METRNGDKGRLMANWELELECRIVNGRRELELLNGINEKCGRKTVLQIGIANGFWGILRGEWKVKRHTRNEIIE